MNDERKIEDARQVTGAADGKVIPIGSLWVDYHGTIAHRRAGAIKRAAEEVLGRKLAATGEEINQKIEAIRLGFDRQTSFHELDGPARWIEINKRAFGCSTEDAQRMSDLIRDENNYVVSPKRLKFVRWLLTRFPSQTAKGRYVLTASNADFSTVRKFVETHGLEGMTPVSGDLIGVYKPNNEFWGRLIGVTDVAPENTLLVANSWRHDLCAARLGVNVVIILPTSVTIGTEEILASVGGTKSRVCIVRSLMAARQAIVRNFVQIR